MLLGCITGSPWPRPDDLLSTSSKAANLTVLPAYQRCRGKVLSGKCALKLKKPLQANEVARQHPTSKAICVRMLQRTHMKRQTWQTWKPHIFCNDLQNPTKKLAHGSRRGMILWWSAF